MSKTTEKSRNNFYALTCHTVMVVILIVAYAIETFVKHSREPWYFLITIVTGAVPVFPDHHACFFQLRKDPGNGSLVLFTDITQPGGGNSLRVLLHSQQALGMRSFQSIFRHFDPFDLLNIMIHTGNCCADQLISVFHTVHLQDVVVSTSWIIPVFR